MMSAATKKSRKVRPAWGRGATPQERLEAMRAKAAERGGRCLARRYTRSADKCRWRCAEGHVWWATPTSVVDRGTWCRICGHAKRAHGVAWLHELAARRGGQCLSTEYKNALTKYRWRCDADHEFEATANHVDAGCWCAICSGTQQTLDGLRELAARRGGRCLSRRYAGMTAKHRWQCEHGHVWRARYTAIAAGHWCSKCWQERRRREHRDAGLKRLSALAAERGGECLSGVYTRKTAQYRWRCRNGHTFERSRLTVEQGGWCPICGHGKSRTDMEKLQRLAHRSGGRCVSRAYRGEGATYRWQCRNGHEWRATQAQVRGGQWCPQCEPSRAGTPWTSREEAIVRRYYPKEGDRVHTRLPGRNTEAIREKARRLGVARKTRKWSAAEDRTVARHYEREGGRTSARLPGRTAAAVRQRAAILGVQGPPRGRGARKGRGAQSR